jgi:outer membrane receptor protein involved in Fe transport
LKTYTDVYGKLDIHPVEIFSLTPGTRIEKMEKLPTELSYGLDAKLSLSSSAQVFAGYSYSHRFPTLQELHYPDSLYGLTNRTAMVEVHNSVEAGIRFSSNDLSLSSAYFHRAVDGANIVAPLAYTVPANAVGYVPATSQLRQGFNFSCQSRLGWLYLEAIGEYLAKDDAPIPASPAWSGSGGIYFWDKLANDHLDLKMGLRGKGFSSFSGVLYDQREQVYIAGGQNIPAAGSLDLVIIAHLGTAYIHVIWENLLDGQYITTSYYPMPDRGIRFGVGWEFTN